MSAFIIKNRSGIQSFFMFLTLITVINKAIYLNPRENKWSNYFKFSGVNVLNGGGGVPSESDLRADALC